MIVISRYLGRMGNPLRQKPPAVSGSLYIIAHFPNLSRGNTLFSKKSALRWENPRSKASGEIAQLDGNAYQYLAVLTLMPGPIVEAITQLRIY